MKKSIWKSFSNLLYQAKLPYFYIILYTVLSMIGSQLYLLFPSYTQQIMAGNISPQIIAMVILVVMSDSILTSVNQFVLSVASAKVTLNFRKLIWKQIFHLPTIFFEKQPSGDLISRVTEDTTKLSDLAATFPGNTLSSIYTFAGTFIILFSYHWKLAATEAIIIPLIYLIGIFQGRVQFSWNKQIQEKTARLTGNLSEILLNIPLIKYFVKEESEQQRGEQWIHRLFQVKFNSYFINNLLSQISSLAKVFHTVLIIWLGILLISRHEITIDIWIAFYIYSQGLLNSFSRIMNIWGTVKSSQGAVQRITELMQETQEDRTGKESPYTQGDIVFQNISFGYEKSPILENLNFTIPNGKTTALIGPSGCGKTTILQLLERLYLPNKGCIFIGNIKLNDISLKSWRNSIGYVSQNPYLFSGSIRENILYGIHRTVTEQEIYHAIEQSQVAEFLDHLPNGLETQIGEEGRNLSGGQRQRIAIARVMLQNPKLVFLDEVTSSLDIKSETMVEQALESLKQGRTVVIIAHKMSAVRTAHQIILLKNGMIHAVGNHFTLKHTNEWYRQTLSIQEQMERTERIIL